MATNKILWYLHLQLCKIWQVIIEVNPRSLTLLHSELPNLHRVLSDLSTIKLKEVMFSFTTRDAQTNILKSSLGAN